VSQDSTVFPLEVPLNGNRRRSTLKCVVAILCAACFLTTSLGSVSRAIAAEPWETWPKQTGEPGVEPTPDANGAARAGDSAGKKTWAGVSAGTIGWIALGAAAVIGIAIAAGGGGGGSSTTPAHTGP
jgi:hypothetical protein